MHHKPILIIVAISSRPYVQAALKAGFDVIALDAFVDKDTQQSALLTFKIDMQDGQLSAQQLVKVLKSLPKTHVVGICYGAGVEKSPELLNQLTAFPLLGNSAEVVKRCKEPEIFFNLCDNLEVPYPDVMLTQPTDLSWLQKSIGGCGGGHITMANPLNSVTIEEFNADVKQVYYQKKLAGCAVSCLFVADGKHTQVIGFNEQWVDASDEAPYRYGGAVSQAVLSQAAKEKFTAYVHKLAQHLGLKGLNSCDAICVNDAVYVLEINPRLSASIDLYPDAQPHLMALHVNACQHGLSGSINLSLHHSKAHQVVYAKQNEHIKNTAAWPAWVCDIPHDETTIEAGLPICTIVAEGKTAMHAKAMVQANTTQFYNEYLH